jgi:Icc-related predicted phosphoesterase
VKIYAAADIHARSDRLASVRETFLRTAADVFIAAGDLFNYRSCPEVIQGLQELPGPVIAVQGNSDPKHAMRLLSAAPNLIWLDRQAFVTMGIEFVGIGGTIPLPFRTRLAVRESSLTASVSGLVRPDTVLVVHPPPFGVCDLALKRFHTGSRGLQKLVLRRKPRLLICGHIHEQAGTGRLGETLVVNCSIGRGGAGALIHLDPAGRLRGEML